MDKLYEWWQLFDPTTRRYYYYNINSEKTAWHLPLASSSNETTSSLCDTNSNTIKARPLASRLVSLLIKNHSLLNNTSTNDLNILYENLRCAGGGGGGGVNVSSSLLEADMMSDEKFLRLFLNKNLSMIERTLGDDDDDDKKVTHTKCLIKTKPTSSSIVSVPLNAAMSSLTNLSPNTNNTTTTTQRRLLPRTNPNYVNVDLIDSNNGKTTIKNTYVRLQDLNGRNEKENNDNEHKSMTSTFNSLRRPSSTNLSNEDKMCTNETTKTTTTTNDLYYQQATTLLLSILKNTEKGECDIYFFKYNSLFTCHKIIIV